MSAPTNVALAVLLLLGLSSPGFAETSHGKPAKRVHVQKPQQQVAPPAPRAQSSGGCFSDDGGGRIRPCESGGGGGGGGGY